MIRVPEELIRKYRAVLADARIAAEERMGMGTLVHNALLTRWNLLTRTYLSIQALSRKGLSVVLSLSSNRPHHLAWGGAIFGCTPLFERVRAVGNPMPQPSVTDLRFLIPLRRAILIRAVRLEKA